MANINISIDDFGIESDLIGLALESEVIIHKAARRAGVEGRKQLKMKSPKLYGDYAKHWQLSDRSTAASGPKYVLHNFKTWGLVHLLEDGHDIIVNGKRKGRVQPKKHFQDTVNKAGDDFVEYIEAGLRKFD